MFLLHSTFFPNCIQLKTFQNFIATNYQKEHEGFNFYDTKNMLSLKQQQHPDITSIFLREFRIIFSTKHLNLDYKDYKLQKLWFYYLKLSLMIRNPS